jgi:hypothetical protein
MRLTQRTLFRYCMVTACAAIVANGCMLDRRAIQSPGTLVPGQYCPGDTLTASYDFLHYAGGTCTPRDGAPDECTTAAPTVTMSSTPALFPTTSLQSYQNSIDFTASGDRVDVSYAYGTTSVFVPPSTLLTNVRDNTETATRITSPVSSTLPHGGDCVGLSPRYFAVEVPRLPRYSPNVGLLRVINANGVMVRYVISGTAVGENYEAVLAPGDSIDTSMPGVPASIRSARTIEAFPVGLMCTPGSGTVDSPPRAPPLNTQVITGCP